MPNRPKARDIYGNFQCGGCKKFLPRESFDKLGPKKSSYWGIRSRCKPCETEMRIKYHSVLKSALKSLINHSKRRNREHTLDYEWINNQWKKQGGRCFYTGTLMTHGHGQGRLWTNVSIDRKNSDLGYTPDNCVLCCTGFNLMKTNLSLDSMVTMCKAFLKNYKEVL